MSRARRLQQEVEVVLKKCAEGVAEWEKLFDKLETLEGPGDARERSKVSEQLKRDLKKLQRLREQVRGWLAAGVAPGLDEEALQEARRGVETQMERFKTLERESKTKAFSAAGLLRDDADPVAVAKFRCAEWLNDVAGRLETQREQMEADLEALGQTGGAKAKSAASRASSSRADALAALAARHLEYEARLERVLRLLENDQVTPEEVEAALKDSLEYYLESHAEDDFREDEDMWSALPLDEVDEAVGRMAAHRAAAAAADRGSGSGGEGKAEGGAAEGAAPESAAAAAGVGGKGGKAGGGKAKGKGAAPAAAAAKAKDTPAAVGGAPGAVPTPLRIATRAAPPPGLATTPPAGAAPGSAKSGAGTPLSRAPSFKDAAAGVTPTQVLQLTPAPAAAGAAAPPAAAPRPSELTPPPPPPASPRAVLGSGAPSTGTPPSFVPATTPASAPAPAPSPAAGGSAPPSPAAAAAAAAEANLREAARAAATAQQAPHRLHILTTQIHQDEQEQGQGKGWDGAGGPASILEASPHAAPLPPHQTSLFARLGALAPPAAAADSAGRGSSSPALAPGSPVPRPQETSLEEALSAQSPFASLAQRGFSPSASQEAAAQARPPSAAEWHLGSWVEVAAKGEAGGAASTGAEGYRAPQPPPSPWTTAMLRAGTHHMPQHGDAEWRLHDGSLSCPETSPRPARPVICPPSFPTQVHPTLRQEATFAKLPPDTAFFAFHFHQGTRQQVWAANALKAQGWRYHTQFHAWFARQGQPKVVTESYEQGSLMFWDAALHGDGGVAAPGGGAPAAGWGPHLSRGDFVFSYDCIENESTSAVSDPA